MEKLSFKNFKLVKETELSCFICDCFVKEFSPYYYSGMHAQCAKNCGIKPNLVQSLKDFVFGYDFKKQVVVDYEKMNYTMQYYVPREFVPVVYGKLKEISLAIQYPVYQLSELVLFMKDRELIDETRKLGPTDLSVGIDRLFWNPNTPVSILEEIYKQKNKGNENGLWTTARIKLASNPNITEEIEQHLRSFNNPTINETLDSTKEENKWFYSGL